MDGYKIVYISIHALLAESDLTQTDLANRAELFLSTLSLRRATAGRTADFERTGISIHALLAESDLTRSFSSAAASISIHALLAESDGGG